MRELTFNEIEAVNGGWEWDELGGAMAAGAITGTFFGGGPGAIGGAFVGAAGYLLLDYAMN